MICVKKKRLISTFKHGCPVENFLFCNNEKDIISIGGNSIKIWSIFQNKLIFDLKTERNLLSVAVVLIKMEFSTIHVVKKFDITTLKNLRVLHFILSIKKCRVLK